MWFQTWKNKERAVRVQQAEGRMVKHSKAEFGRTYVYGPSFDASPMTKDVTNPKDIQTENLSFLHWSERGSISFALFPPF